MSASPSPSPFDSADSLASGRLSRASSVPVTADAVVSDGEEQQRRRLHIVANNTNGDRQYHTDADENTPSPSPCSPATPLHSSNSNLRGRSVSITTTSTRAPPLSPSLEAPRRGSELTLMRPYSPMQQARSNTFSPLDTLSPSRRLISTAAQSSATDAPSLSTFKLAAYAFTAASAKPTPTSPPPYTLTLDPVAQTLTIASMDGATFHSRPFASLAMCTHSMDEPTTFTVYYVEGKAVSRCVALSSGEAIMQYTLLMSFIDQVRAANSAQPREEPHAPSLILATRILKKSQLRWKPLYLTLHPFLATLHSSHRLRHEDVLKRVNLQGCSVREWCEGGAEERERVLVLEQPGGKATQFKCASGSEREVVVLLMRKAMSRTTEGGADSDWSSERTEESKGEVEEGRPSVFSEMHQRLQVTTSHLDGKIAQLSLTSPSSFTSLSSVNEQYEAMSPHSSPSPPPAVLSSPHRSLAHAAQLRQVKQSRRRSRRSMSKDFQQLKDREVTGTSVASPSASSLHSAASSALSEFVELPADPRPPPMLSSVLSVGVYQLLSTLLASLMGGCALSSAVYVPRAVWWQHGRKVQAYVLKVECLELLYEHVLAVSPPPATGQQSPSSAWAARAAEESLYGVRCVMDDIHERLAQHLPYLQPPAAATRCRPRTGQSSKAKDVMQRLLVKGKDAASVGWRRLDGDEVQRYCTAVQHVLEAVAVFSQWHAWLERSEASSGGGWGEVRDVLAGVDVWLYAVLGNVLVHDLMVALRRYMKYSMRLLQEKHQMRGWSGQKGGPGSAVAAVVGRSGLKASSFLQSAQR